MAKDKKVIFNQFTNGVDSDTDDNLIDPSTARFLINCRLFEDGNKGKIKTVLGNTQIPNSFLPAGNNICIGWGSNEERSKFYWFNWNSNNYHGVYCYNDTNRSVTTVIQNLYDTNNVDIFHFDPNYLINHVDIIQDNLIYWVDGLNKARKFNIAKAIDKSSNGYGTIIIEDFITAYKQTCPYPPSPVYFTDLTRSSNYLYALQFKFAQRFIYDDKEQSNVSDFSVVPLPPNESFLGNDNITYNNNGINVQLFSGSKLVTKVEVLVKINDLDWQSCIVLDKAQLGIADNTNYVYAFYNDGPLTPVDNVKVVRPYSYMPRIPYVQSFVKLAMTYGNANEGFPVVPITASVAVTSTDLFLPDSTTNLFNSPAFTISTVSNTRVTGGFLSGDSYWETKTHFIVGHDVKKGNTFVLTGTNGVTGPNFGTIDNYYKAYTANVSDSAETVASIFKQFLRTTGRGVPDAGNGISNEVTDISGNVSWDYTYLGHDNTNPTLWSGTVNPINYSTLKNNGLSVNVIKSGSPRKYAIVYEDDDGRKSLAYTCDALLAKTPFLTQWGTTTLQQPIHTITITNRPPSFAKYWYLVRTPDITDFIQMLIQQVTAITVVDEGNYLDLVVGSIYTYQLIHPNTVITYQFQKGDRVRLIKNENTGTLYEPYFETEVLSYKELEEQTIAANIVCNGTTTVTPVDGVKTSYIGKNISINGVERTIVTISGSSYIVNEPISPNISNPSSPTTAVTYPNYIIIDRRGILRINATSIISTTDLPLIEVYHPQKSISNDQRQDFFDFGMKFGIANYGTDNAAHFGNIQNQDPSNPVATPCIVQTEQGDAYIRQRALPTNSPDNPQDAQVIIDSVEDPNFSDFYQSNLYSTGRVYPQDDGAGVRLFDQRERFSNNYIQNTNVNGLNDFDNADRKDYNDPYGGIMLTRFRRGVLHMYKLLKNTWAPVSQQIIVDNSGQSQLTTTDKLLNDIQYSVWEGGIGKKGCWFENGDYMYNSSDNSGVFIRTAQDGAIPISSIYHYDKVARDFLSVTSNNNLQIIGQFDKANDEAIFSYQAFIKYLFQGGFNPSQWQTLLSPYLVMVTWTIIQQPANSVASIVGGIINITGTNTLGDDYLLYQGSIAGGGTTPVTKFCFTVVANPNRQTAWVADLTTAFCLQNSLGNTGEQGWKVLKQIYTDDSSATGLIMPNIQTITSIVIVHNTSVITYNVTTSPSPSGGSNGDVWYNLPVDALYVKISGVWTLQTGRLINADYVPPVEDLADCPLPPPPSGSTININNTTTDFTIAYVKVYLGATLVYSKTTIGPGGAISDTLPAGTYTVNVKVLPSTDGGTGHLSISSAGTPTVYPVSNSGITQTQTGVTAPIIVQLDV